LVFKEELLINALKKYASNRAKVMDAWIRHFRAIRKNMFKSLGRCSKYSNKHTCNARKIYYVGL
jgi:hypothetical protein